MNVKTIGIDLAKNVFQIHGVDEHGKRLFNKQLRRAQMASFFANIPPCLIGMEACASAHFWANKLISMGHNVKLMAPQFVKPYVKPISMMLQTLKLFVKPSLDLTCGSCRSKPLSSKPYWHFTGVVRASSNSEPHKPIKSGGYWPNLALSSPEVSSSYSDDYLSSWKMRITRYPSCFVHS